MLNFLYLSFLVARKFHYIFYAVSYFIFLWGTTMKHFPLGEELDLPTPTKFVANLHSP